MGGCQIGADLLHIIRSGVFVFLYSELEGQSTKPFFGPVTFGEVSYQLVNQTTVGLRVAQQ